MEWQIPVPLATTRVPLVDGATVILRRHGNPNGPRLIFSHANGLSSDAYFPMWSRLVDDFDIILYDLRNHGVNPLGMRANHSGPMMALDSRCVVRAIDRHFGNKPKIGVFHSLSATVALLHAADEDAYEALVLFDPVICPPKSGRRERLRTLAGPMANRALRRQSRFPNWQELAQIYQHSKAFERLSPDALNLIAQTTLRPVVGGTEFELCCPPSYEAQMLSQIYESSIIISLEALRCPVKVIGADPLTPFSFLPATDPNLIAKVGYDFIPETTHYLPLEEPEDCAALLTDFVESLQKGTAKTRTALPAGGRHMLHDFTLGDVEEALRLVDLEQRRLLGMLSGYLDAVRRDDDVKKPREAGRALLDRLEESLDELAAYGSTDETAERDSLMARQKLLGWLEQQIGELCELLPTLPSCPPLDSLSAALIEGIDVVLLVLVDTVESGNAAAWPTPTQLTAERGEGLRKLLGMSRKDESLLAPAEGKKVLRIASISVRIFSVMGELAHEYRWASRVDDLFLEHAEETLAAEGMEGWAPAGQESSPVGAMAERS